MRALKEKIQSQSGASITFALLLFLVCSIVSSIVIVAGTAAAGRMKQLAETDQRYYAVMSAVELLKQEMVDKGPVAVNYESYQDSEPSSPGGTDTGEGSVTKYRVSSSISPSSYSIQTEASERLVSQYLGEDLGKKYDTKLQLTTNLSEKGEHTLSSCSISKSMESNGVFSFLITNPPEDGSGGTGDKKYVVSIKFRGRVSEAPGSTETNRVKMVTWELYGLQKLFREDN